MEKHWVKQAVTSLKGSLEPVPHEINELDWKVCLSDDKERLVEHMIAFANLPNGGCLVFGISDAGAKLLGTNQAQAQDIITRLSNLGRDAIEPPLVLDHAIVEYDAVPLLLVYISEHPNKPVHRRGKSIEDSWIRSGGTTRKASRADISFTNPGTLLPGKRLDRLIGTTPESRNELLASKFRLYRICEERGTGFQKVVSAVELFGMPPVVFTPMENAFQVTLYAPRKFADMAQEERVEACYQHAVLQYFSSQTLTNTTLRTRFKVSERQRNQITNLIGDAVEAGRIKRKDSTAGNKFAEYVPYWA